MLLALSAVLPSPAVANPLELYGFGPRSAALGSACTALCTDAAANFHNPGALAAVRQVEVTVGYSLARHDLRMNGRDVGVDDSRGLTAGMVIPGRLGPLPFAVGAGLFLPDQRLTRVRALPAHQPRFALFDNKPQRLFIATNLAIEPLPGLQIGGGFVHMAETGGTVVMTGDFHVPDTEGTQTSLVTEIDVDIEAVRYLALGARWQAGEGLAFGVAWQQSFRLELDLTTVITGQAIVDQGPSDPLVGDGEFSLRSRNSVLFSPQRVTGGVAWEGLAGTTLVLDLVWAGWSEYPAPTAKVEPELSIEGIIPADAELFPRPPDPEPAGFHDTISPRAGIEHALPLGEGGNRLILRAGYTYDPTPAPVPTGRTNLVDNDRHTAAAGIGLDLVGPLGPVPGPLVIEAHGSWTHMASVDVAKADPADPVGDYEAGGRIWTAGLWTRIRF